MADIEKGYEGLKGAGGYNEPKGYPADFQATDFPKLAGEHKVALLGNDQAFFFVKNPSGNSDPAKMTTDTTQLEKLMGNIYDNKTQFTMMIDKEVLADPQQYAKNQRIPESERRPGQEDPDKRETRLAGQAQLISTFVNGDGIEALAEKVISEKNPRLTDPEEIKAKAKDFLKHNFKLDAVTPLDGKALPNSVWEVHGPKGELVARQDYHTGGYQLGTKPELDKLKEQEGPHKLLEAVKDMHKLKKSDATHGLKDKAESKLHADLQQVDLKSLSASLGAPLAVDASSMPLSGAKDKSVALAQLS